ncbi:MAG TPA: hypothetical protein VF725_08325 [Ktedonobacterales bacterium]
MRPEPTLPRAPMAAPTAESALAAPRRPSRWLAIPLFCLLACLIPETVVTSATSVTKIIGAPFSLVFVAVFYGTADLVIREAIVRRRIGLAGKLLLGAAFGFYNEGVVAGTWYTVAPKGYVFLGVWNWGWAVSLTVFHVFVSVLAPIYLFDSVMPSYANTSLLRRRGIIVTSAIFLLLCLAIALGAHQYRPERLAVYLAALLLIALAFALPRPRAAPLPAVTTAPPAPGLWRLRLLGFLALLLYFIAIYAAPSLLEKPLGADSPLPALLSNGALLALAARGVALVVGWSRRPGWSPRRQLALITGACVFGALISAIGDHREPLVTAPFILLLIILAWRARRAERPATPAALSAPAL